MSEQKKKPRVVCLCGSTRFKSAFVDAQRRETLAGRIYLSVGLFGHLEGLDMGGEVKAMLDELHLAKIDLADEVLVLDVAVRVCPRCATPWRHDHVRVLTCSCGTDITGVEPRPYIGDSTRREIAYAELLGKPVRYLSREGAS